ncbi:MAG: hypothetical protein ACOH18_02055 [Candidatus Saccharimonadaceae bacterium]
MNTPIEWLRFLPITLAILYILSIALVVLIEPLGKGHSISEHAAASRNRFLVMAISLTVVVIGIVAYFLFWLGPTYKLPPLLTFLSVATLAGGLGTAWLPASSPSSKNLKMFLHVGSVMVWFLSCFAICVLFTFSVQQEVVPIAYTTAQCANVILAWLALLYVLYLPARNHFVLYESIGIFTFFSLLIVWSLMI